MRYHPSIGPSKWPSKSIITNFLANIAKKANYTVYVITFFILIASMVGILKLEVENSFINYFDKNTEIYN